CPRPRYRACAARTRSAGSRRFAVPAARLPFVNSWDYAADLARKPPRRRPQRAVNHPRFTSVNHKPRLRREDVFVRRAGPHCLALAGAGAAVLAAAFAHAQPATIPNLRPGFEETDQDRRPEPKRPPARRDTRPAGTLPTFGDMKPQTYATVPGLGAGTTGF